MNVKELFDYYNTSKAHEHLNCSIEVAESFLNNFPPIKGCIFRRCRYLFL